MFILLGAIYKSIPKNIICAQIKAGNPEFSLNSVLRHLSFNFLKSHLQFNQMVDLTSVDYPEKFLRFEISCILRKSFSQLISKKYTALKLNLIGQSIILVLCSQTSELKPVISISNIYPASNWAEREVWDLYGVFFLNHPDLRRLVTDYGFQGHPFRKDFPLTGYVEVRYDSNKQMVIYEPVQLAQEFRLFDFVSPWSQS